MLDEEEAEEIYAVVIRNGVVDVPATEQRRAELSARGAMPMFMHGFARQDYEKVWPTETSVAFANAVLEAPPGLRTAVQRAARPSDKAEADHTCHGFRGSDANPER